MIAHQTSPRAALQSATMLAGCLVHPRYIVRVAGEPVDTLAGLGAGEADAVWREATALDAATAAEIPARCAYLEGVVPALGDKAATRAALDIKRALFRGKAFAPTLLDALAGRLVPDEAAKLAALGEQLRRRASLGEALLAAHDRDMAASGEALRPLLGGRNLMAALSYTNPEFLLKLDRHYAGEGRADAKATRNIEDSLLQYHARSSTKTSPLSSFTVIDVGRWGNGGAAASAIDYAAPLTRRVEVKAGLIRHIMAPLLERFEGVRAAFALAPNGSIKESEGRIRFHAVAPGQEISGRTFGTGLAAAQMDPNGVLRCIAHVFAANGGTPLLADDLARAVCALAPKLTPDAVLPFIARLYAAQYLVIDGGPEQQDALDWAEAIAARLDAATGPALVEAIGRLRGALAVMTGDDAAARAQATLDARRHVVGLAELTGADPASPLFKPPFYENCYLQPVETGLDIATLVPFEREFALLQDLSHLLDANQELQARMCDFFVARHGAGGACADIPGFLEAFDDIYAPGILDARIDIARTAPNSPRTEAWLRAAAAFDGVIEPLLDAGRDIDLELDALDAVVALIPPSLRARGASYSYVVQHAEIDGAKRLVLNQVFGGRSSILSRFLEVADNDAMDEVRAYVAAGSPAGRSAELPGVFGFNANRHPRLADAELAIPPFPAGHSETAKLALAELELVYSAEHHRLEFRDAAGERVDLFYHGLLIPSLLPQLHRVLALAFTEGPSFAIMKALVARAAMRGERVSQVPRITMGGVVLFRRSWLVAAGELPDAALPARDFYAAARDWQRRLGLPTRCFLRTLPLAEGGVPGAAGPIAWQDVNFKDMKPFFVDFASPRFVRLLQNMLKRSRLALCVSELLPDFDSHPTTIAGRRHVSELHFELTRAPAPVAPRAGTFAIRTAYFAADRSALMQGPLAAAVALARAHGAERAFLQPHWKFGPHVDLVIQADAERFHGTLFPAIQALIARWLEAHPSRTTLDPADYDQLSRNIGMFELDAGPYLPLLRDNSVALVPYRRARTLVLPALAASREQLLSDSLDLTLTLDRARSDDKDGFFLALFAMLAATADTYALGMREGFMSLRSHADYFFAAHDVGGALKARFDAIDAARGGTLDAVLRAVQAGRPAALPLAPALRDGVGEWLRIIGETDARNRRIVAEHRAELIGQTVHADLADALKGDAPAALRERVAGRKVTAIGEAFLFSEAGLAAQRTPEFLAYRTNVNFFYALLPILAVPPMQKFLLCHLVANAVARVFGEDWRARVSALEAAE